MKKLGFASRSQLQKLHSLGGERNANRILKELSVYLCSFRDNENIYYLNKEGRERVGSQKALKKTQQARHFLMRNDLYIALGCPASWKNEIKLEIPGAVSVVADALFMKDGSYFIIEIDHLQKMSANREKVKKYRRFLDLNAFDKPPVFVWVTTTEYRRKQLTALFEGMNVRVYLASEFK